MNYFKTGHNYEYTYTNTSKDTAKWATQGRVRVPIGYDLNAGGAAISG